MGVPTVDVASVKSPSVRVILRLKAYISKKGAVCSFSTVTEFA